MTKSTALSHNNACSPPDGSIYLTIGQDLFSIQDYVIEMWNYTLHKHMKETTTTTNQSSHTNTTTSNPTINVPPLSHVLPSAFMVYTDIQGLRGLDEPTDYGSGIEYADGLLSLEGSIVNPKHSKDQTKHGQTQTQGLQIGLWLDGSTGCQDILNDVLKRNLKRLYQYIETSPFQVLWIRVGYEFDNPDFGYTSDPEAFRDAFQKVVQGCRAYSRTCQQKAIFVWHSWAAGLPNSQSSLQDFYPGDDHVDWVGISLFQQFYRDSTLGDRSTVQEVLDFASDHKKPVMIAESTPFRGFRVLDDPWNEWFEPVLELMETNAPLIQMWSYINCDWESQPMWHNVGFGETRLAQNKTILRLWNEHVLQSPLFLQAKDGDLCSMSSKHKTHSHHSHHHHSSPSLLASLLPSRDLHSSGGGIVQFLSHYWYVLLFGGMLIWGCRFCLLPDNAIYSRYLTQSRPSGTDEEEEPLIEENRTGYGTRTKVSK